MDTFCCLKQSFNFTYQYSLPENGPEEEKEKCISESIQLPLESNITTRELAFLFMRKHKLPESLLPDVLQKLETFIENRIDQLQFERVAKRLEHKVKLLEKYRNFWLQVRYNNLESITAEGNKQQLPQPKNDNFLHEDNFYQMYHEIVHSGILTPQLILIEKHNSEVIRSLLREREEFLENLTREQNLNVESILLSGSYSDKEINSITKNNVQLAEKRRKEWKDKIASVRADQKREFCTWIKNTYEDWIKDNSRIPNSYMVPVSELFIEAEEASGGGGGGGNSPQGKDDFFMVDQVEVGPPMEESYTINLGSQLKTTHNLRLISVDILKFCSNICTPQRLQTAMSLYSNSISAIVRLVDKSISIKSEFAKLCLGASENHFADFDAQMAHISADLHRLKHHHHFYRENADDVAQLNVGDVYITKHSNFSEAHVVFHLVTDDSLRSPDINSRHPVILGIRNILKIAYIYDIAHISIPLLLLHDMNEDITIQWCLRRAELVLKCVKGFMIEMSSLLSLNDNENKTIQFVVPKGISHELFSSLSAIFPSVFRLSNTLFLTTNSHV